ncbi:TPA: substrate-binding domain-containing protein, partial [Bacillus anthracis]|nr:substrate-binding domain-containing protein [Bacillus anthracis]
CLLNSKEKDDTINYLNDIEFPFVVIGRPDEVNNVLWVDNNNVKAMYDLVQMLIDYGHKEIAFIGAKANLNVSRDRLKGYKQALIDNRIEIKNSLIYEAEEFTQSNGSYAINKILDSNRPTAVVATD